ncbi:zinc-ribbon domain-containing protein [Pseudoclavibacter soli]|uniref:zinc-ribbon domain-containing protein n=1 Tax=Pseudoclavibacter soli TaxID=452623 RepID=UPI0012EC6DE8
MGIDPAAKLRAGCPSCGARMPSDARFCPECGTPAAQAGCCPTCSAELAQGAGFCAQCGNAVA